MCECVGLSPYSGPHPIGGAAILLRCSHACYGHSSLPQVTTIPLRCCHPLPQVQLSLTGGCYIIARVLFFLMVATIPLGSRHPIDVLPFLATFFLSLFLSLFLPSFFFHPLPRYCHSFDMVLPSLPVVAVHHPAKPVHITVNSRPPPRPRLQRGGGCRETRENAILRFWRVKWGKCGETTGIWGWDSGISQSQNPNFGFE